MSSLIEFFSGSGILTETARAEGIITFNTDIEYFNFQDWVIDILDITEHDLRKRLFYWGIDEPSHLWFSPPCTSFSVASISKHWKEGKPISEAAKQALKIIKKVWEIISWFPEATYFIENPRGMLRKQPIMNQAKYRHTVTYCQYGEERMKPTDIWTNNEDWQPRKPCKNGMSCHVSAPRGSRTGTQGIKGNYLRSILPKALCKEIVRSIK